MVPVTTVVAVFGPGATDAADTIRAAGGTVVDAPADADIVVALGEDALLDAAEADDQSAPVLPVGAGREYGGVGPSDREAALDAVAAGDFVVRERQTFAVSTPDAAARALADATLVTTEPAKISEYTVTAGDDREVASVRADGVVAATPTGSRGYATDAGGPRLDPEVDAAAVVPIAPFRVDRTNWVVEPPLSITVVRDEATVELHVDGRTRGEIDVGDGVTLSRGAPLSVAAVPASRRPPQSD